ERLRRKALFRNDIYLSIIRRPRPGSVGLFDRLAQFAYGNDPLRDQLAAEKRALEAARAALASALSAYGVRALGTYKHRDRWHSELLEFLAAVYNGQLTRRLLPEGDFGEAVPSRRVSFGRQIVELAPSGGRGRSFLALLSMKEYPGHSSPG